MVQDVAASSAVEEIGLTGLRRVPRQERGRARVDQILEATEALVLEMGPEAITTNHIAVRAGVDIAGLYYFFEDKFQIFAVIVGRAGVALRAEIEACGNGELAEPEEWIDRLVDCHWSFATLRPATLQLFQATRGRPEMEAQVRQYDAEIVDVFAAGLKKHCQRVAARRRLVVAQVVNLTLGELLFEAARRSSVRERNALVEETRLLLRSYLCTEVSAG